jgi:hypothetical protein
LPFERQEARPVIQVDGKIPYKQILWSDVGNGAAASDVGFGRLRRLG